MFHVFQGKQERRNEEIKNERERYKISLVLLMHNVALPCILKFLPDNISCDSDLLKLKGKNPKLDKLIKTLEKEKIVKSKDVVTTIRVGIILLREVFYQKIERYRLEFRVLQILSNQLFQSIHDNNFNLGRVKYEKKVRETGDILRKIRKPKSKNSFSIEQCHIDWIKNRRLTSKEKTKYLQILLRKSETMIQCFTTAEKLGEQLESPKYKPFWIKEILKDNEIKDIYHSTLLPRIIEDVFYEDSQFKKELWKRLQRIRKTLIADYGYFKDIPLSEYSRINKKLNKIISKMNFSHDEIKDIGEGNEHKILTHSKSK